MNYIGRSISGIGTAIIIPEYKLCFDIGTAYHKTISIPTIAVSHGHMDHLGDIVKHCHIREMSKAETTYIIPPWLESQVLELFKLWSEIEKSPLTHSKIITLEAGESLAFNRNKTIKSFLTDHRIDSQGYIISDIRRKLNPKYYG